MWALLTSAPEGATAYVEADMRDTATVLEAVSRTLDLSRPVGLVLSDVLGHVVADDEARRRTPPRHRPAHRQLPRPQPRRAR